MDEPDIKPSRLARSLRFIRFINAVLGYRRVILRHLDWFGANWQSGQPITIIDLATGSADIPRAILRWADRRGLDVSVVGVDRHPVTAGIAARLSRDPRLTIAEADVSDLPFAPGSFDYPTSSMFLHHLDDADIVRTLRTMDALARRGIIVSDLLRHRRAYLWIKLLTLPCPRMLRHDACVLVAQSLDKAQVMKARQDAGLAYTRYCRDSGHRWALAGEKSGMSALRVERGGIGLQ